MCVMVLKSAHYDDVYFSAQDGLAETRHVFLAGNGLSARFAALGGDFSIAESGFGTGLNFLAAWKLFEETAPADAEMHFISFEKHSLSIDVIQDALAPWSNTATSENALSSNNTFPCSEQDDLLPQLRIMEDQYKEEGGVFELTDRVRLTLVVGDINEELPKLDAQVDAWFLDGFRPSSNPDMWTEVVFQNMARLSKEGTTFATFTAAGFVRRGLEEAGFEVSKRAGFGTKREMAVGTYKGVLR